MAEKILQPFTNLGNPILERPEEKKRAEVLDSLSVWGWVRSFKADKSGIWLGAEKWEDAPFRVDMLWNFYSSAVSAIESWLQTQINTNASAITLEATNRANADWVLQSQITVQAGQINLKVSKDSIISEINISPEAIKIAASKIQIDWTTTFASGYDPSIVHNNLTTLQNSLWDVAYADKIEYAMLSQTTIISWGYIRTSLLNVQDIFAQNITADWSITLINGGFMWAENSSWDGVYLTTDTATPSISMYENNVLTTYMISSAYTASFRWSFRTLWGIFFQEWSSWYGSIFVQRDSVFLQDLLVEDDLYVSDDAFIWDDLYVDWGRIYISGTNSAVFLWGIALEKIWSDLYWNGVKIN